MSKLGSLLKDTVIYGMSSIVGRFLNYLLVPLYTAKMSVDGIHTRGTHFRNGDNILPLRRQAEG